PDVPPVERLSHDNRLGRNLAAFGGRALACPNDAGLLLGRPDRNQTPASCCGRTTSTPVRSPALWPGSRGGARRPASPVRTSLSATASRAPPRATGRGGGSRLRQGRPGEQAAFQPRPAAPPGPATLHFRPSVPLAAPRPGSHACSAPPAQL